MQPLVLESITLSVLLETIIQHHADESEIIICSSRASFLDKISRADAPSACDQADERHAPDDPDLLDGTEVHEPGGRISARVRGEVEHAAQPDAMIEDISSAQSVTGMHSLAAMSLQILSATRDVRVSFCPDLSHLLAHLSNLSIQFPNTHPASAPGEPPVVERRILAIVNLIDVHKPTSSYSVQGLNKTFAAARDVAFALGAQLLIAECPLTRPRNLSASDEMHASDVHATGPWDEQVSMLNVTTKTFGVGESGWVGRTVPIRVVAERWCRFVHCRSSGSPRQN